MAELGPEYKDFDITNWFGFFAPANVPEDIRKRLNQTAVAALKEVTVITRVAEQGAEAVGNSPEEFAAFIRAEVEICPHRQGDGSARKSVGNRRH